MREEEKRWKVLGIGPLQEQTDSEPIKHQTALIECPLGHDRRATLQEQTESVIWCEKCGQSYEIDWMEGR